LLFDFINIDKAEPVRIPIFGLQKEGYGILARIENGAPLAELRASISGKINSYNYVFAQFTLRGAMSVNMLMPSGTGQSSIPVVERPKADLNIVMRYTLLTKEHDGYAGMARYERERLIREGALSRINATGDVPFYMDLIGSIQGRRFIGTIAYQGQIPMTTFDQAAEISEKLRNAGISRQVINYQGWFNRGYYHDVVNNIKPVRQLGNVKKLEDLGRTVEQNGGRLYSDVIFQNVPYSSNGKGYRWYYETSRFYAGGMVAGYGLYICPFDYIQGYSMGYPQAIRLTLSPKFLGRYVDSFIKSFNKYDVSGVSLRDLGDFISSDRKRTEVISRAQAEEIVRHNFDKLSQFPLMVQGGNYYSFNYAERIIGMPLSHNAYYIVDEEIPFLQMILSGCVEYAGEPFNLSNVYDEHEMALKLIEFGASPRFTFTANQASDMKETSLAPKYSTTFDTWEDTAVNVYNEVNRVMSGVFGRSIINHEILGEGFRRVTYEGGVQIYVNYNYHDVSAEGVTVPARSSVKTEAGGVR